MREKSLEEILEIKPKDVKNFRYAIKNIQDYEQTLRTNYPILNDLGLIGKNLVHFITRTSGPIDERLRTTIKYHEDLIYLSFRGTDLVMMSNAREYRPKIETAAENKDELKKMRISGRYFSAITDTRDWREKIDYLKNNSKAIRLKKLSPMMITYLSRQDEWKEKFEELLSNKELNDALKHFDMNRGLYHTLVNSKDWREKISYLVSLNGNEQITYRGKDMYNAMKNLESMKQRYNPDKKAA